MRWTLICLAVVLSSLPRPSRAADAVDETEAKRALSHLRPAHPRLLVLDDQLQAVRAAVGTDSLAKAMHDRLRAQATKLLTEPVSAYVIGGPEHTLLSVSRAVEGRVMCLAGMYRLDGDRRWAARAVAEMRAAAAFPDWYPTHFLDTAEMTAALAVGYDWCFDAMSADDRAVIRRAIVDKGLDPGIAEMQPGKKFSHLHNNWVQVCYGGLTLGALALADDEPDRAAATLAHSMPAMATIMALFAPDGGFEEGPGYWNYATTFNTYYLAALDTAVGADFHLSDAAGFADTGAYRVQTISPSLQNANFGDADTGVSYAAQMFWMASRFHRPLYAREESSLATRLMAKGSAPPILELLWQFPRAAESAAAEPLAQSFERIDTAFMRTSWGDPAAGYVAFKGGDARASHGHLDLGQVICETAGQRWAVDLGADTYGLPGYFGKLRYTYFRCGTAGHNTLTVDDQNESTAARAPLKLTHAAAGGDFAVADLTACYPLQLKRWRRGVALQGPTSILIQDEVDPARPARVVWHFHTRAAVEPHGGSAKLTQGGVSTSLRIDSPADATFTVVDASHPPAPNAANPGLLDVQIELPKVDRPTTIAVELTADGGPPAAMRPIDAWR
jgi:hypothetical protein